MPSISFGVTPNDTFTARLINGVIEVHHQHDGGSRPERTSIYLSDAPNVRAAFRALVSGWDQEDEAAEHDRLTCDHCGQPVHVMPHGDGLAGAYQHSDTGLFGCRDEDGTRTANAATVDGYTYAWEQDGRDRQQSAQIRLGGGTGRGVAARVILNLSFRALREANVSRCKRWHPGFLTEGEKWTGADWSNAMCGEAGETANVVKKLRRIETGADQGPDDPPPDDLRRMLADEIADTVTYADLLAAHYGIDLAEAIAAKFNRVSERQRFPERLFAGGES